MNILSKEYWVMLLDSVSGVSVVPNCIKKYVVRRAFVRIVIVIPFLCEKSVIRIANFDVQKLC